MASMTSNGISPQARLETKILPVDVARLSRKQLSEESCSLTETLVDTDTQDARYLRLCAEQLQVSTIPVAFPTETVYGLGADATRSEAVKGIYRAKQRPADNPLIVHFASLRHVRKILRPGHEELDSDGEDPIPPIYKPLIERFWPGPLTILLQNPADSVLSPEVTAGLSTFGARIPRNLLALALIQLADRPIAAPSANVSTKPSPTAAEHVFEDLQGRIEYILDGGPCDVGVESTVVDGLSNPPTILRPGGISINQLRRCPGWDNVTLSYKDKSETGDSAPKAPGMKYRHYSPKAPVILYESATEMPALQEQAKFGSRIGIITTKTWHPSQSRETPANGSPPSRINGMMENGTARDDTIGELHSVIQGPMAEARLINGSNAGLEIWQLDLGECTSDIARGLFSALRDLDKKGVDAILVEGIDDQEGDLAAAVMNRLRKAAEVQVR